MLSLRFAALLAASSIPLSPLPLLAQPIGTTAAVVPDAFALGVTATPRVIEIGDQIISNQTVETNENGLVQILLADGSSFTIGPNSSLVIDSFVYDPQTDTASLAATASRGFLRFIGGAASKSEAGAAITTPVGTAGIRGAIVDISASGQNGLPPGFSLVFGSTLSVRTPDGAQQTTNQPGQTIFVSAGTPSVVLTPPQLSAQFSNILTNVVPPGQSPVNGAQIGQLIQSLPPAQPGTGTGAGPGSFAPLNQMITSVIQQAQMTEKVQLGTIDRIVADAPDGGGEPEPVNPGNQYHASGFGAGTSVFSSVLGSATVTYDANAGAAEGKLETSMGEELFAFGPDDATVAPDGALSVSNEQGNLQTASELLCAQCDFMSWGTWSTTPSAPETVENGYWVLGDQTTAQQIEGLTGSASYAGNAVGFADSGSGAGAADGTFTANMNFASGMGRFEFEDFGNDQAGRYDFDVLSEMEENGRSFVGLDFGDPTEANAISGDLQGGVANDGSDVAGGIMGGFSVNVFEQDWSATGVFAGTRQN